MRIPFDTKPLAGPSGQILTYPDFVLLAELENIGMIAWSEEEITFHAGFKSHIYVQGRNDLSNNPETLMRLAAQIKENVERLPFTHGPQKCVIGIPTAGTQLAQAVSTLSWYDRRMHVRPDTQPLIAFSSMRSVLKGHGKNKKWVGDADLNKHSYITIENVVSTAAGMIENFEKMRGEGYPIERMHHVMFADWELGGTEALAAGYIYNVHTLYKVRDIVAAYVYLGLWPQERYDDMVTRFTART